MSYYSSIGMSIMLGITWIPGLFGSEGVVIQFIFDVFTGLQGFFIFLLFVVFPEDARKVLCCGCCSNDPMVVGVSTANGRGGFPTTTTRGKYLKKNSTLKPRKGSRKGSRVSPECPTHRIVHVTNGKISKTTFC